MRVSTFALTTFALACIVAAQAPTRAKLDLRGDRFRGLTYEELTPEQKKKLSDLQGPKFQMKEGKAKDK